MLTQQQGAELPPAMLIDMDDTIITHTETSTRCWGDLCVTFAPRLPTHATHDEMLSTLNQIRREFWSNPARYHRYRTDMLGSRRAILTRFLNQVGMAEGEEASALAHEMAHHFTEAQIGSITAFPGAIEAVRELRARGLKLALITNGEGREQRRKIERFDLAPLFDCVIVEGEFGKGKPEPEVYHHALNELGVAPHEAWMVGDNLEWEVAVPKQLGLYTVWVDFAAKGLPDNAPAQPDRIIHNLAELVL
jgi:putative hydrolase of the HAD superfamily